MDPDDSSLNPPLPPPPSTGSVSRPSSSSTHIAVDMHSTPEENLYAAAQAMREGIMRGTSRSKSRAKDKGKAAATTTTATTSPPPSASASSIAHPTTAASSSSSSSSSSTSSTTNSQPASNPASEAAAAVPEGGEGGGTPPFTFDKDMARYPASMTSSVRDHVYEGGLRYHAYRAGKYAFPNDEVEQNRDDMKHTMTLMLCRGAYFYAPVEGVLEEGGEVLDLGTGTGIWAMELGDKYPNTTITGIDLSPIQPTFVPENVHFFVDDFEEEWVDPEDKYDFIHLRHTLHSVQDPPALLDRAICHLKPGGYFEAQELAVQPQADDDTLTPETPYALRDYINYMAAGMRILGSNVHAIGDLPEQMRAAGFQDVRKTTHKCPVGVWPRDKRLRFCGLFLRTALMDGLRGLSRRPLTALGWTPLQIEIFLVEVRKAIMEAGVHAYLVLHVVHGRKPVG
ncbi:S-adenosyl-L-methionine-dependent methyltransferase [Parachaetomium inaequale]|uniref:S-adenosyl-L-methionine-dependent methyltransferase n=1 Tax=Parachaetomium inaequale TaxID=2588326 RepID=A0AAN6SR72_9PEZI|nr:S-adenosyl-L-methionine-dependent methyltransferase [Parachaetomium inaequale]